MQQLNTAFDLYRNLWLLPYHNDQVAARPNNNNTKSKMFILPEESLLDVTTNSNSCSTATTSSISNTAATITACDTMVISDEVDNAGLLQHVDVSNQLQAHDISWEHCLVCLLKHDKASLENHPSFQRFIRRRASLTSACFQQ